MRIDRVAVGPLHTNCWVLADSGQALVLDPGDEPEAVRAAVEGLEVIGVALTHAHADHVLALEVLDAPVLGHPAEQAVWRHELAHLAQHGYFDAGTATEELLTAGTPLAPVPEVPLWQGEFDRVLGEGDRITLGSQEVRVLHTPGHTPGGLSYAVPGHLFTGDTLFPGGPGLTGWPLSDFDTIIGSVRRLLREFPGDTLVHPGHGANTTIGQELPHLEQWRQRGW
ncbi:MBL fold metallo-hydrolase [Kutzneria viridogrisea]|uniref:Metallo-beta-lactamase domain-containing protein n=2 Tax=Kutzneria TaxID=43356 RepID=W5WI48_9PSEU|nr:MBL fold metallo-hydrolase [Kutzneria albida]AHI00257.1 hypothetical protein KALB_6898 [Kutzneria albida DSM 43870]MBA8925433.1 hydroxyacylglutathione hydrolase [Kutzneria viridogrisea]